MRAATGADLAGLTEVLARAFAGDPFHQWLFPDAATRPQRQRKLFDRVLSLYLRNGKVFTTVDGAGAALWDPPRESGPSLGEMLEFAVRVLPVFGSRAGRIARGMKPMVGLHPTAPHWYLSILGTDPLRQRSGVGRTLLRPILERCDREGLLAYLEASRPENVPYYERFGFRVVAPLTMPDGPTIYRMERHPRPVPRWTDEHAGAA
ncbi:MAG TPA: GNAT family N-acetyltransferase [Candidatus Limnocylindrales bacterium]|nr:GNAT family N-acetyltransferase [Candidatus Limnocylindrales bacterium]